MDKTHQVNKPTLFVTVKTHEDVLFEGEALSVTSRNDKGVFDVLPQHTNFISLLASQLTIRDSSGQSRDIPVSNGVMRVRGNRIEVYLGIKK